MKNVLLAIMAIVWLSSCEAQSTTDPDSNVVAQDPKCLLRTQWGFDKSQAVPNPDSYYFSLPTMNFNTETEGFFTVGMGIGKFRNNTINHTYEVHFKYTISGDKLIFDIKSVKQFGGIYTKLSEETGVAAVTIATELMNFFQLNGGVRYNCNGRKLSFLTTEASNKIPFKANYWVRTN
jgi:hypothetical protein